MHGSVNTIGMDTPDSKLAARQPLAHLLAQIEKFTGALPHITAFERPPEEV